MRPRPKHNYVENGTVSNSTITGPQRLKVCLGFGSILWLKKSLQADKLHDAGLKINYHF